MNSPWARTDPNRKASLWGTSVFSVDCAQLSVIHGQHMWPHADQVWVGGRFGSWQPGQQIAKEDILPSLVAERLPTPEHSVDSPRSLDF